MNIKKLRLVAAGVIVFASIGIFCQSQAEARPWIPIPIPIPLPVFVAPPPVAPAVYVPVAPRYGYYHDHWRHEHYWHGGYYRY